MCSAAPLVSASDPVNAALTSNAALQISGLNFGGTSSTATVSITTADVCSSTTWTSSTTVACATSGRTQPAIKACVSVSAFVGTVIGQFTFDGMAHIVVRFVDTLRSPHEMRKSLPLLYFAVHARSRFHEMPFALKSRGYLRFACEPAPCASLSSPSNIGITGGGSVTIRGLSFGGANVTPTASLTAAEVCSSAAWTSATTVMCAPAAYGGTMVRTAVSVSALAGTVTGQFSFDGARHFPRLRGSPHPCGERTERRPAPVVSTASANAVPSDGGTVTIGGLNFGTTGATATVSLTASEGCGSTAWTSTTTVLCAPQAYGGFAVVRTVVSVSAVGGTVTGQFSFDGTTLCRLLLANAYFRFREAAD